MSITTTKMMVLKGKSVQYLYTDAPNSKFFLNTSHIELSSIEAVVYKAFQLHIRGVAA